MKNKQNLSKEAVDKLEEMDIEELVKKFIGVVRDLYPEFLESSPMAHRVEFEKSFVNLCEAFWSEIDVDREDLKGPKLKVKRDRIEDLAKKRIVELRTQRSEKKWKRLGKYFQTP